MTTTRAALLAQFILTSAVAAAATGPETGVINGATLHWMSANTIQVMAGWAFSKGTAYPIQDTLYQHNISTTTASTTISGWDFPSTNCTGTRNVQVANQNFYLYLGYSKNNNVGNFIVISPNQPTHDAYPNTTLSWKDGSGNCLSDQQALVFLGSYLADNGGTMVPFSREGNEVHLYADQNATNQQPSWNESGWWIATTTPPNTNTFSFQIPISASAAIVDIWSWTSDPNLQYAFFIEDPYGIGVGAAPNYDIHPQMMWFLASNYTNFGQNDIMQARLVPDSNGHIVLWTATKSPTSMNGAVAMALKGYVENVRAPGR